MVDPIKIIFVEMHHRAMIAGDLLIFQWAGMHGASFANCKHCKVLGSRFSSNWVACWSTGHRARMRWSQAGNGKAPWNCCWRARRVGANVGNVWFVHPGTRLKEFPLNHLKVIAATRYCYMLSCLLTAVCRGTPFIQFVLAWFKCDIW